MMAARFNCHATLLLIGVTLRGPVDERLGNIFGGSIQSKAPLLVSASSIRAGVVLRVAGEQVEEVGREIYGHLALVRELLGDDPWARKW
jgi:hypothetical protein